MSRLSNSKFSNNSTQLFDAKVEEEKIQWKFLVCGPCFLVAENENEILNSAIYS